MIREGRSCDHKAPGGPGHHIWHSTGLDVRRDRLIRTYCCYGCGTERIKDVNR